MLGAAGQVGVPGGQDGVVLQRGEHRTPGGQAKLGAASSADRGLALVCPRGVVAGAEPGVLDQCAGAGEPGRVAGLGQDGRGTDRGDSGDGGGQGGEAELVEDAEHAGLGDVDLGLGVGEVGQGEPDPLEPAGALGEDPGGGLCRVGRGVEDCADDLGVPAGGAMVGQLHAVITTGIPWDPAIAAGLARATDQHEEAATAA